MGEYAEQAMSEESIKKYGVDVYEDLPKKPKTPKNNARTRRRERRKHLQEISEA